MKSRAIVKYSAVPGIPSQVTPALSPIAGRVKLACQKLLVLSLAGVLGMPAWAADPAPAVTDNVEQELQILRQLAQQMLQRIDALEKIQKAQKSGTAPVLAAPTAPALPATPAAPVVAAAPAPAPSLKLTPKGFKFTGNTVYKNDVLQTVLKEDIGKEVDFEGLTEVADKIKAFYRSKGYFLAVAVLPKQEIEDGVVTIEVLEGRIGKIEYAPVPKGAALSERQFKGMIAARLKEGDLITENSLERPLLQLRDLPGVEVRSTINPGDSPGTANITLEMVPPKDVRKWNGTYELDNSGNRFAGEYRASVKANLNAPLGIGDTLSISGTLAEKPTNVFGRAGYLVPFGNSGTRVGANISYLDYALGKEFKSLDVKGSARVTELVAVHPFIRTKEYNLVGQFGLEKKGLVDKQLGVPDQEKDIHALKFQLNGDLRGDGNVNTASVDLILGNLKFRDAEQLTDDQSPNGFHTAGRFAKINFSFNRLQQFSPRLEAMFSVTGQLASKNLTSAEKFTLGGANRVRGYPAGEAGGDQGFVASAELRYALPEYRLAEAIPTLTAFYDFGLVKRNRDLGHAALADPNSSNTRTLQAIGVGFKLGVPDEFLLRSDLAWGRSGKPTSDTGAGKLRLWFQGIRWF